jgi:hypothetical protein
MPRADDPREGGFHPQVRATLLVALAFTATPTNPTPRHRPTSAPSLLRSWQEAIRMGGAMGDSQEPASALVPPLILKAVIPPSGTAPEVIVPLHACNVPTAGPSSAPTLSAANHPLAFGTTGSQSPRNGGSGATNLQTAPVSTSRNQRPP